MTIPARWYIEFLQDAALNTSNVNQQFLIEWHKHATTNCKNNPIDLSVSQGRSSNCAVTSNPHRTAQTYKVFNDTYIAFEQQIHSGDFPHLLAALQHRNVFAVKDTGAVADDLDAWGSASFASRYRAIASAGVTGPGSGPSGDAQTLRGWHDLQRSVNRHMPEALRSSQRSRKVALREAARASKVRIH